MKIKNYTQISFFCGLLAALFRFIQYEYFFDGTYFTNFGLFSTMFIIVGLIPMLIAFLNSRKMTGYYVEYQKVNNVTEFIFSSISAIACVYAVFSLWKNYKMPSSSSSEVTNIGVSMDLPVVIVTAVLAIYLIFIAIMNLLKKGNILEENKMLELIPVLWCVLVIIYVFINHTMTILVSENVIVILMLCLLLLTLFEKAKTISKMDDEKNAYKYLTMFSGSSLSYSLGYFFSTLLIGERDFSAGILLICITMSLSCLVFLREMKQRKILVSNYTTESVRRYRK